MKVGDRVEMISMPEDPNPIEAGTKGTICSINKVDFGREKFTQISVKWDSGRTLMVVIAYFDEDNNCDVTETEMIKAGEEDEVVILGDHGETVDIRFSYGTLTKNVDKKLFIEVK